MREITRIHIAKVAYDIEVGAKKDLEKYISALERYANDPDILDDIEIRVTELLAEHGVQAGGVITAGDVAAVRAQLGEPSDFVDESAEPPVALEGETEGARRVYRDTDNGILGGVMAGIARFFNIDPLWVRLLFIVLLFGSFGTAFIIYLILWLIIPPAETAAEKLRMSGRSVTLASIKELAGNEVQRSERAQVARRILSFGSGLVLVAMAIASLLLTVSVIFGAQINADFLMFAPVTDGWIYESGWFMAMVILFILSGVLFSALCFLLASAAFRKHWSRRIGTAVVAIIASGLVLFATGVGTGMYGYTVEQARVFDMHETTKGDLPAGFGNAKKLVYSSQMGASGPIQYHVSDQEYYELIALPGVKARFDFSEDGSTVAVKMINNNTNSPWDSEGRQTFRPWDFSSMPILNIYGPAFDEIEVASVGEVAMYHSDESHESLGVTLRGDSRLRLSGKYDKLSVYGEAGTNAMLEDAVIGSLRVRDGAVTAGVVRTLSVNQPDVCSAHEAGGDNYVKISDVSSGKLIYNGKEQPAKSISGSCGEVVIGNEFELEEEW